MSKSDAFIRKVTDKLLARKDEIHNQLAGAHQDKPGAQVKDIGDEALSASMDKLQNSLEQTEINEVNLITSALSRIERGDYGACVDCDEGISDKRLEHSPYAARCIVCQEELESGQQ